VRVLPADALLFARAFLHEAGPGPHHGSTVVVNPPRAPARPSGHHHHSGASDSPPSVRHRRPKIVAMHERPGRPLVPMKVRLPQRRRKGPSSGAKIGSRDRPTVRRMASMRTDWPEPASAGTRLQLAHEQRSHRVCRRDRELASDQSAQLVSVEAPVRVEGNRDPAPSAASGGRAFTVARFLSVAFDYRELSARHRTA
jgi:hypothetical protein